jgi:signal transduction histidine kinase
MKNRGIGFTLTLFAVLLVVIPLAVVVVLSVIAFREAAEDQAVNQMGSVAEVKTNEIETWLESGRTTISLVLTNDDQYKRMELLSRTTRRSPAAVAAVQSYLNTQLSLQTVFEEFFVYGVDGEIKVSTNPDKETIRVVTQPYYEPATQETFVQRPYYDIDEERITMVMSEPIRDINDEIVGVFVGRLNIGTLSDIMTTRVGLGDTGETYLVTSAGSHLVTPSRFESNPPQTSYTSSGIRLALDGGNGSGIYENYRDAEVIGTYRWIPELQSAMMAEIEQEEAFAAIDDVQQLSLVTTLIAALLAIGVATIGAIGLTRPIRELTDVANAAVRGDYSRRVAVRSQNEVGQLSVAFNTMTDEVVKNLEERERRLDEINEKNRELRVATAKAREAARLKGEFLATVSHELRTPLNAIIGFSDMLLMGMSGELNEKQAHQVKRLQENGKRLLNLINNILDVTRIESGRVELVLEPFNPHEMAFRMRDQMEVLAHQKGLDFELEIDPDLPAQLMGDEKKVEQIIVNLTSNAVKFTEEGTITLKVHQDNHSWVIEVRDTGIGIPPHAIDYIFDEFRQVDGSSTRAFKGSGLGLTITRNLVLLMEGKINVKSKMGEGSTFTVSLPVIENVVAAERVNA